MWITHRLIVFPPQWNDSSQPSKVCERLHDTQAAQGATWYLRLKKKKYIAASHKLRPHAANASLCFEASHARLCRMAQPTQTIPHLPICISQRAFASSQPECAAWALFNKVIPFYVVSEEDVTMGQVTATKSAVPRFCRHKPDPVHCQQVA